MPKISTKKQITVSKHPVVLAKSTLKLKVEGFENTSFVPKQYSSGKIQLMELSNSYWTLKIKFETCGVSGCYDSAFVFEVTNFPKALKKDCSFRYQTRKNDTTLISETLPYSSKFSFEDFYSKECADRFTVILDVLMDNETSYADIISGRFNSQKHLLHNISSMCSDESLTDFTFTVMDKKIKVHRSILAASSPMMLRMFTADYKEKETGECTINDIEPEVFEALISFMYCCTVPENLGAIAHELYAAAHYYEVEKLKDICLYEIQKKLSVENAMKAYTLAFNYDLQKLLRTAWKIIKRDILKVDLPENPMPPKEVAEILEIRNKTKLGIGSLQKKMKAQKRAGQDEERAILCKYIR